MVMRCALIRIHPLDLNSGIQGEFESIDSDGPGPLRCKLNYV